MPKLFGKMMGREIVYQMMCRDLGASHTPLPHLDVSLCSDAKAASMFHVSFPCKCIFRAKTAFCIPRSEPSNAIATGHTRFVSPPSLPSCSLLPAVKEKRGRASTEIAVCLRRVHAQHLRSGLVFLFQPYLVPRSGSGILSYITHVRPSHLACSDSSSSIARWHVELESDVGGT